MLAVTGTRARSKFGVLSNPTTPRTPCHQDEDCDATSFEDKYSSCRLPVPAAVEDAVVFIRRQSILPLQTTVAATPQGLKCDVGSRADRCRSALYNNRNALAEEERETKVKAPGISSRKGTGQLRVGVEIII
jgi:hypothetical protein